MEKSGQVDVPEVLEESIKVITFYEEVIDLKNAEIEELNRRVKRLGDELKKSMALTASVLKRFDPLRMQ